MGRRAETKLEDLWPAGARNARFDLYRSLVSTRPIVLRFMCSRLAILLLFPTAMGIELALTTTFIASATLTELELFMTGYYSSSRQVLLSSFLYVIRMCLFILWIAINGIICYLYSMYLIYDRYNNQKIWLSGTFL